MEIERKHTYNIMQLLHLTCDICYARVTYLTTSGFITCLTETHPVFIYSIYLYHNLIKRFLSFQLVASYIAVSRVYSV